MSEYVENIVADSLEDLKKQIIRKEGKVKVEIRNPVNMDDRTFSFKIRSLDFYRQMITEIRFPISGNLNSSEDGKMLLHRKENGLLTLERTFGELEHAEVPCGVDVIGTRAFENSVISVFLPDTVSIIEDSAFQNCSRLKEIRMPKCLKKIGRNAFEGCESLKNIQIPDEVEEIDEYAFNGCRKLSEAELPEKIRKVDFCTFSDCLSLQRVVLKKNVKYISDKAFLNCANLSDILLPEGLKFIGYESFFGCVNINHLKLPASLELLSVRGLIGVQAVEISKPIPQLGQALMGKTNGGKGCFSVIFADKTLIFPREMGWDAMEKVSDVLENIGEMEPGVHSYYKLATKTEIKQETAWESFRLSHNEEIGKYLRRCAAAMLSEKAEKGEKPFTKLFVSMSKEKILTEAAAKKAFKISQEKGWAVATDKILQIMEERKKEKEK